MNERIKELILKAGFPKFDKMYVVSDGEELEKFAELIVKKCAYLVNDQQRTTGYTNHAEMLCKEFDIEFKEEDYFGVEE